MAVGKMVRVSELMLHEASRVESDTSWLSDRDWQEMVPMGSSVSQLKEQFESGEWAFVV